MVLCGTGAVVVNNQTHGVVSHVGISAVFGLIVTAMIYTFGDSSGAHINPAVTLAFTVEGTFDKKLVPGYLLSQTAGALVASYLLRMLFPADATLGATLPTGSGQQSFILEILLAFMLMLVILRTAKGAKETGVPAGLTIGGVVMLEALFAGPISGASMNPARSLAPALVSGHLEHLWIYVTAPFIGCLVAVYFNKLL